ncbi:hypothetical protein ETAA8_38530 [Anatilimnocola aggregata]|uniref:Uncharacterized protein n=1 Tax=Anatilimnocola aggregata TaxID=2528021 RepID=A0A517YEV1_9BACT|nr:DUF6800 family protein [Anatilimnocola aggregata]QDU28748.1 hypothetical protein ETAA8_38530 [Anatilimnocola aggregata]
MGGTIHRMKELRQRRHRKKKLAVLKRRAAKASPSEKAVLAAKLRRMTPGAEVIIATMGLEEKR